MSEAEQSTSRAEERLYYAQEKAELDQLRAISEETRKWEEREARLVRHLEELEQETRARRHTCVDVSPVAATRSDLAGHGVRDIESTYARKHVTVVTPGGEGGDRQPDNQGARSTTPVPRSPVGGNSVTHSPLSIVQPTTSATHLGMRVSSMGTSRSGEGLGPTCVSHLEVAPGVWPWTYRTRYSPLGMEVEIL